MRKFCFFTENWVELVRLTAENGVVKGGKEETWSLSLEDPKMVSLFQEFEKL